MPHPRHDRPATRYGTALTRQMHRAKLRQLRLEETRSRLPAALMLLAVFHLAIAPVHALLLDGTARWVLTAYAAGIGLVLLLVRFGMATPGLRIRQTVPVGLLGALGALSHAALLLFITEDPVQAVYLVLLVVAASGVIIAVPLIIGVAGVAAVVFVVVWVQAQGGLAWAPYAVALLAASLVAAALAAAQTRALTRTLALRMRDEQHMTSMARATKAATESEVRFRRLAEAAFEAIIVHENGRVLDVNQAATELVGAPRERIVGHRLDEFVSGIDTAVDRTDADALDHDAVNEHTLRRSDGTAAHVELRGRTIPFRGGTARVLAVRDVSETRRLEAETRALAERLERILAAAGEGIYGVDAAGRTTFTNPAALQILGYREDEVLGIDLHALVHHTRPDGSEYPPLDCPIHRAYTQGQASRHDDEVFHRRDGTVIPVEYTTSPIIDDGRPVGAVVVFHDISERRELERMKDELVSVVSHEIKTPLTSIHGSLRLLAAGTVGALPEPATRMVGIAEKNTARLMRLVQDILDIDRLQSGHMRLETRLVEAGPLITEAVETMRTLATEHRVTLATDIRSATLWCDHDRVIQTLTNLLSNAIKYSPPGEIVRVRTRPEPDMLRIEIEDRGPGIPAVKRRHVFERFYQVDASDRRKHGGTGLGLAIAKEIVERHGGTIGVKQRQGGGTVFWFTLPLAAAPRPKEAA